MGDSGLGAWGFMFSAAVILKLSQYVPHPCWGKIPLFFESDRIASGIVRLGIQTEPGANFSASANHPLDVEYQLMIQPTQCGEDNKIIRLKSYPWIGREIG